MSHEGFGVKTKVVCSQRIVIGVLVIVFDLKLDEGVLAFDWEVKGLFPDWVDSVGNESGLVKKVVDFHHAVWI